MANDWPFLAFCWLVIIVVSLVRLNRKLDRILKHLGLDDEAQAPKGL